MNKRKREDSISEDCMMEVQINKNVCSSSGESVAPQCLRMLDEIMRSGPAELVERSPNPLGASPLGNHVKRVTGYEIAELDEFTATVDSRLKQTVMTKIITISDQMRFLRQQLVNAVQEAQESSALNHTPCNFRKVPGNVYYLYQRPSEQNYFSLLSPSDWNEKPPHQFCGSYLYDHDFTWKKL